MMTILIMMIYARLYAQCMGMELADFAGRWSSRPLELTTACTGAGTAALVLQCIVGKASVREVMASEKDPQIRRFLESHFDIEQLWQDSALGASMEGTNEDLCICGPPCPPYSICNHKVSGVASRQSSRSGAKRRRVRSDNSSYDPFAAEGARPFFHIAKMIRKRRPKIFIMEQVLGICKPLRAPSRCLRLADTLEEFPPDAPIQYMTWGIVAAIGQGSSAADGFEVGDQVGLGLVPGYFLRWLSVKSGDYGSPQARCRMYLAMVRHDICSQDAFETAMRISMTDLPRCHQRASASEVAAYTDRFCAASGQDMDAARIEIPECMGRVTKLSRRSKEIVHALGTQRYKWRLKYGRVNSRHITPREELMLDEAWAKLQATLRHGHIA
jgi:site-specific DNA-cytosine methylase